jgi:iron complex transport system substrate-binding protein
MRLTLLSFILSCFVTCLVATAVHAQARIITAGSVITETVCALGDCDKIIASDRTSLYPANIQQLPSIGYRSGIQAEGIISLKPTLVIAEKDYVNDAVLQQLSQSGIKLVIVDRKLNFEDTKKLILQIGGVLGREREAKKLITQNEAELAEANGWLKKTTTSPRVLGVYNHGTATIQMAGKDTFAEILNYVGAANAVSGVDRYKPMNAEALIAANPDYLLMLSTGVESIGGVDGVLKIAGVAQTTAGIKKQILIIDSLKLTNFGPRFGETVKELVMLLHPELRAK